MKKLIGDIEGRRWFITVVISIISLAIGFFSGYSYHVNISGNNNTVDSYKFKDSPITDSLVGTFNNSTFIISTSTESITQAFDLSETEKEFFDTIREVFGCDLEEGIVCDLNFVSLGTINKFENVKLTIVDSNKKEYVAYVKSLHDQPQNIAFCADGYVNCQIFPQYMEDNNPNFKLCYSAIYDLNTGKLEANEYPYC